MNPSVTMSRCRSGSLDDLQRLEHERFSYGMNQEYRLCRMNNKDGRLHSRE